MNIGKDLMAKYQKWRKEKNDPVPKELHDEIDALPEKDMMVNDLSPRDQAEYAAKQEQHKKFKKIMGWE